MQTLDGQKEHPQIIQGDVAVVLTAKNPPQMDNFLVLSLDLVYQINIKHTHPGANFFILAQSAIFLHEA